MGSQLRGKRDVMDLSGFDYAQVEPFRVCVCDIFAVGREGCAIRRFSEALCVNSRSLNILPGAIC